MFEEWDFKDAASVGTLIGVMIAITAREPEYVMGTLIFAFYAGMILAVALTAIAALLKINTGDKNA